MTGQQTQYLATKHLSSKLGPGPWIVKDSDGAVGDALLKEIVKVVGGHVADYGAAEVRRRMLVKSGAIAGRRIADGTVEFTKADTFPEPPAPLDWVAAENKRLADEHRYWEEQREQEWARRKANQAVFDAPLKAAKAGDFAHLLKEHGGLARLEARLDGIEQQLQELTRHLAAQHVTAGVGSHEASNGSQGVSH